MLDVHLEINGLISRNKSRPGFNIGKKVYLRPPDPEQIRQATP